VIQLSWDEIVALGLGELLGKPADGAITRVHDDSRQATSGDLFVALNSGGRFVEDALTRGAATLVPHDQHAALALLAKVVRSRSSATVVAVVGSTGKTSTKDALAALCAAVTPTVAAEASKNNEIGLPLTVLRLEPDTRVLVTEMGMRGHGQIAELCAIADPSVVVIPSIGPEHLELVGTVADVARANAEAIDALPPGGVAVVPADAPELEPYLGRHDVDVRRFDRRGIERVPASYDQLQGPDAASRWRFQVGERSVELALPFDQRHLAENVLAALTAYDALGLPLERAQEGASEIRLSSWRGEVHELAGGGIVINDAYNANPTSMRAALLDLAERAQGRRRVAILGEMAELGLESARYHDEIGALLKELGIEVVIGVGEPSRLYLDDTSDGHWIPNAAAFSAVEDVLRPGDAILVKASRAVGLEGIAASIENQAGAWFEF
jgi:UDP-N-acetylmuramoyl-tripeptide--D-alanyl-D-alanine ligase